MVEPRYSYHHMPDDEDGLDHLLNSDQWDSLPPENFTAVKDWCRAAFGDPGFSERWLSNDRGCAIWLRLDQDVIAFRMRWC